MECMAGKRSSVGNTSNGSQSHLAHAEETRFARSLDAVTFCARRQKHEGKSTADNPLDTKASARIVVPGHAKQDVLDIRRDSPTACREAFNAENNTSFFYKFSAKVLLSMSSEFTFGNNSDRLSIFQFVL